MLNQSCRRCHNNDLLYKPVSKNGIRVQHQHLIEAGFLCMRCHSTQAHGTAVPAGSRTYPSMDQCLLCHNNDYTTAEGQVATSSCDLCHTKRDYGATPASHKEARWATDHGAVGILSTCSACHVKKPSCVDCHDGVRMPHATDWVSHARSRRARRAAARTARCVTPSSTAAPATRWRCRIPPATSPQHPKAAAWPARSTCFNCHRLDNCQACHEQHSTGDPQAHQLFKGVKYTPAPSDGAAAISAVSGGE